jgi:hypothetical protein
VKELEGLNKEMKKRKQNTRGGSAESGGVDSLERRQVMKYPQIINKRDALHDSSVKARALSA